MEENNLVPGSPEAIAEADLLEEMACIYPGDQTGNMMREACELRGIPYDPPEIIVTFGD